MHCSWKLLGILFLFHPKSPLLPQALLLAGFGSELFNSYLSGTHLDRLMITLLCSF